MTAVGAPDFQGAQQWSDNAVILSGLQHFVQGSQVLGPFPVSQWLGLSLFIGNTPNVALGLQLFYWADAAATIQTANRAMVLGPLQAVQSTVTLPNLGAYVTVQANNSTGPAADWPLTLAGTNRIGPTVTPGATTPLVERFIVSVGAGATQNTDFAYFFTGHAHVTFQGGISAGEYKIEQLDETGAVVAHLLRRTLPIAAPGELLAPVMIPPGWLRLAVVNTGGAPASYTATVNPEAWSNYT